MSSYDETYRSLNATLSFFFSFFFTLLQHIESLGIPALYVGLSSRKDINQRVVKLKAFPTFIYSLHIKGVPIVFLFVQRCMFLYVVSCHSVYQTAGQEQELDL